MDSGQWTVDRCAKSLPYTEEVASESKAGGVKYKRKRPLMSAPQGWLLHTSTVVCRKQDERQ